jgi:uncharacterized cupredoxin-like copper-binding protein
MITKKSFPIWAFFVALMGSIFLAACGAGGNEPVTNIDVDMTDHKFTPNEFTVPAGAEITINLTNSGTQRHEFRAFGAKGIEDKDGESTKYWSAILAPGESKSLSFTAPSEPGSYTIKCTAPGHAEAGLVGTLHVK